MSATRPTAAPFFSCVNKVAVISADSCLSSLFVGGPAASSVPAAVAPPLAKVVAGVVERRRVFVA